MQLRPHGAGRYLHGQSGLTLLQDLEGACLFYLCCLLLPYTCPCICSSNAALYKGSSGAAEIVSGTIDLENFSRNSTPLQACYKSPVFAPKQLNHHVVTNIVAIRGYCGIIV